MKNYRLIVIGLLAGLTFACNLPYALNATQPIPPTPPPANTTAANIPAPAASETAIVPPTAAATATITATTPPSATATITPTPTQSIPMVTPLKDPVNCRFGPSVNYEQVFALIVGASAPITGKSTDGGWWQIKTTDTDYPNCWVNQTVVVSSGDLSGIPTAPTPASLITDVQLMVKPDSVNLGPGCVGPFPKFTITGTISTNGPMKVTWYIETQQDGKLSTHTLSIPKYGSWNVSVDFTPSNWQKGNFWAHLFITSPNSITRSVTYQVMCQ